MAELIEANWLVLVIALLIGIVIAWWLFVGARRTKVAIEPRDEAADQAGPRRNQALIDAPPAAAARQPPPEIAPGDTTVPEQVIPPAAPAGLAGAGETVQAAARPAPLSEPASEPIEASAPAPEGSPAPPASGGAGETSAFEEIAPPADELTRIKGLGPKLAIQLRDLGVTGLAQIAAWDEAEIDRIDAQLGRFEGRIRRDQWPEQARLLAAGDTAAYEDRFGKL